MMISVVDWGYIYAHFMTFERRLKSTLWAKPRTFHWVKKAGPKEPNSMSLLSGEWYCRKLVGHIKRLEKYKCVSQKVCARLSKIDDGREWWLCLDGGILGGACLCCGFTYRLINKSIRAAKSCARAGGDYCIMKHCGNIPPIRRIS